MMMSLHAKFAFGERVKIAATNNGPMIGTVAHVTFRQMGQAARSPAITCATRTTTVN